MSRIATPRKRYLAPGPGESEYGERIADLQAEQSAVATLLLHPHLLNDPACPRLGRHEFWNEPERLLFGVIEEMVADGRPTSDQAILVDELKSRKHPNGRSFYEAVGGAAYICDRLWRIAEAGNYRFYAESIREKSIQRAIKVFCNEIYLAAHDLEPEELIERLESGLRTLKASRTAGSLSGFQVLTCADLDGGDFEVEYLIPNVIAAHRQRE
jgi:replicative DNA helicase